MIGSHELQHGTTKAAHYRAVFYSNDLVEFLGYLMQHRFIQWFYKAHIVVRRINTFMSIISCKPSLQNCRGDLW